MGGVAVKRTYNVYTFLCIMHTAHTCCDFSLRYSACMRVCSAFSVSTFSSVVRHCERLINLKGPENITHFTLNKCRKRRTWFIIFLLYLHVQSAIVTIVNSLRYSKLCINVNAENTFVIICVVATGKKNTQLNNFITPPALIHFCTCVLSLR